MSEPTARELRQGCARAWAVVSWRLSRLSISRAVRSTQSLYLSGCGSAGLVYSSRTWYRDTSTTTAGSLLGCVCVCVREVIHHLFTTINTRCGLVGATRQAWMILRGRGARHQYLEARTVVSQHMSHRVHGSRDRWSRWETHQLCGGLQQLPGEGTQVDISASR